MADTRAVTLEECMDKIRSYITDPADLALVEKAYQVAHEAHAGQFRKSGEPYEIHVIQVAYILAQLGSNAQTVAAGFLHDTVEDNEAYTYERIKEEFSEEIADLVEGVTKVGKISNMFKNDEEYQASNHRKIFIAMAKDPRVIYIKLADRLHNLRTLEFQPPHKQKRIAKETLDVYAPIAHRLGISVIKTELEDISFKYLWPEEYQTIRNLVSLNQQDRSSSISEMIGAIETLLDEQNIPYEDVFGRYKHFYSIYKKMRNKRKEFSQILDLQAIRIITDTKQHCYDILGQIHSRFLPIPGRFKDYIAVPKDNMYQSLHTIVKIPGQSDVVEIQIRTKEMDEAAEVGIAAHFRYKEKKGDVKADIEDQLTWFRGFALMADEDSDNPEEFVRNLYNDIFGATLYVFSPKGRMISLPKKSTPVDFAYRIHTEVGHHTVGAKVNGSIVPLNYELQMGDVVEILTNRSSPGPSLDWIKFVQSAHARNKIKNFYQRLDAHQKKELAHKGEQLFLDIIKKHDLDPNLKNARNMEPLLSSLNFKTAEDLYLALAAGRYSVQKILDQLEKNKPSPEDNEEILKQFNRENRKERPTACGVIIPGIDNIQVSLAPCCSPVPGDEIAGFVSRGKGIKVHRKDCPNLSREPNRTIDVRWADDLNDRLYKVNLEIHSEDRNFLLSDIVTVLQQNHVSLRHIDAQVNADELTTTTKLELGIKDLRHLNTLISNLSKIRSVYQIERSIL